jgi:hypothetical protein
MTMRYRASEIGAKALGISVQPLGVREPDDFEQAFSAMNGQTVISSQRLRGHDPLEVI